ncbi:MAG: 4'-phosphopantetheinyl transferase superfamily protein [Planctomycetes bacterium]|nr:4'-phosphopantetheinyl transferase superfamily protein [Planctomycetota bacterium]
MNSITWHPLSETLSLQRDTIHIVRVGLESDDQQLDQFQALLSPDESARADRFKVSHPRRHFIVCRAVVRQLLGQCLGCDPTSVEFDYGPHGKPAVRQAGGPRIEFSVSHSSDQGLIALTLDRRIGVDLEEMNSAVRILKLATRFFSTLEALELASLPEAEQLAGFYRGWTCKEAYLKATGSGLSFPLNRFSVSLNPHVPAQLIEVVDQPEELTRWRLLPLEPKAGFAAAVMVEASADEVVSWQLWSVR